MDGGDDGSVMLHVVPDATAADGGLIYAEPDGRIVPVDVGPDGRVTEEYPDSSIADAAANDSGQDAGPPPVNCDAGEFSVVSATGAAPLYEAVQCGASGSQYDFGDGAGFGSATSHRYMSPGTFTVTQKAADGSTKTASVTVTSFTPVKWSTKDHTILIDYPGIAEPNLPPDDKGNPGRSDTALVTISGNGYELSQSNGTHDINPAAARSDGSLAPGSGIFYFEGHRLTDDPWYRGGLGIATKNFSDANGAPAIYNWGYNPSYDPPASRNQEVAIHNMYDGTALSNDGSCSGGPLDPSQRDTGYIVDYRGTSPKLMLLQAVSGTPKIVTTCTLPSATTPVFIYLGAERAKLGPELVINTGADTTNIPFAYGDAAVRAALTAAGDSAGATALVMGYGATNPGRLDSPPNLTVPGDMSVAVNTPVTLTASAIDLEDGDLSAQISWVDNTVQYDKQVPSIGASFSFTPSKLGVHPVTVLVRDMDGVATTKVVNVTATGSLPQQSAPQLVATTETMTAGIKVSSDGLSAAFLTNNKDGLRANQGLIGDFWYFEVHRNSPTRNLGIGLVVEDGQLIDYEFNQVPWSCSINLLSSGEVYINLIYQPGDGSWEANSQMPINQDYGYAVDFTGTTPVAYVIIANKVQATLKLDQTYEPVYPMLYGNGQDCYKPSAMDNTACLSTAIPTNYDMTINFGNTPFHLDPVGALRAAGVDTTRFKKSWGPPAQP